MAHYAKLGANNKVIAVHVVADSDCYNADGEKMDNDDIEDFYYEQGYDEDDNNVGVELGRPLPSDTKPPTIENLNQLSKITTRYNK